MSRAEPMHGEKGSALIELVAGLSILVTLILGAAEFGRLAYAGIEVSNAAHAGAAYGSESRTYAADITNIRTAATQDAPDVPGLTATASYFCQCSNGSSSTCAVTDCSTSRIITYITVNTTGTINPLIYLPGLPKSYILSGQAVMRVEQ